MVSFRETPVTDEAARKLLAEYFGSRELDFPSSQGNYRTVFPAREQFDAPRGLFLVVESESTAPDQRKHGTDVGCGGIRRLDTPSGTPVRFEVKHLWLQPRVRGRGFGRLLLDELEQRAVDFGAEQLVLDTNDSLVAAGGLYRSRGFTEIAPYNDNPNATTWFLKELA